MCRHAYLDEPRPSKQKGGTLLARGIRTLEEHEAALADPDKIRPPACPACLISWVHVHDRRDRVFRGEVDGPAGTQVVVFRCTDRKGCGAVWRVLPEFLARHLWRRWSVVGVTLMTDAQARHRVPSRTRLRWRARLESSAAVLIARLDATGVARWTELAARVGSAGTRRDLVEAANDLAGLAAAIDHQQPGVRVM
jgi:hypothetical protein